MWAPTWHALIRLAWSSWFAISVDLTEFLRVARFPFARCCNLVARGRVPRVTRLQEGPEGHTGRGLVSRWQLPTQWRHSLPGRYSWPVNTFSQHFVAVFSVKKKLKFFSTLIFLGAQKLAFIALSNWMTLLCWLSRGWEGEGIQCVIKVTYLQIRLSWESLWQGLIWRAQATAFHISGLQREIFLRGSWRPAGRPR